MLPPFRVRRNTPYPAQLHIAPTPSPPRAYDSLAVQLSHVQYDRTVKEHPEASLKYVDDDDGEIITVSFELHRWKSG